MGGVTAEQNERSTIGCMPSHVFRGVAFGAHRLQCANP